MNKASAYKRHDDKTELVNKHTNLVKKIAHHLIARLPSSVLVDDLIQAGMIGLLEAAKNFDDTKGASFETFAGIRIRGAMLDDIRKGDWTPRSVHKNSRSINEAITEVERRTGKDAKDTDVAKELNVDVATYHTMLNEVNAGRIIGFDDLGGADDAVFLDNAKDSDTPHEQMMHSAFNSALTDCIKALPEREAIVLSLYYDEELNLREIGQILDVSESRVSQIHSQAMVRLKGKLNHWQEA